MKQITPKSEGYNYYHERYVFDKVPMRSVRNPTLVILYTLCQSNEIEIDELIIRSKNEGIGYIADWEYFRRYAGTLFKNRFPTLKKFLQVYDDDIFELWNLKLRYQDVEISMSGTSDNTEVGLSYPIDKAVNILPLLTQIENELPRI